MLRLIIERVGLAVLTLVIISVVVFISLELMPGDACTASLGRQAKSEQSMASCRERLALDLPAHLRYAEWAGRFAMGDLGTSMQRNKPISEIVGWRLRNTLVLTAITALIGIPLSIMLGVICGLNRDRPLDVVLSSVSIFAMTIPEFISATVLILTFAIGLGWTGGSSRQATRRLCLSSLPHRCCRRQR